MIRLLCENHSFHCISICLAPATTYFADIFQNLLWAEGCDSLLMWSLSRQIGCKCQAGVDLSQLICITSSSTWYSARWPQAGLQGQAQENTIQRRSLWPADWILSLRSEYDLFASFMNHFGIPLDGLGSRASSRNTIQRRSVWSADWKIYFITLRVWFIRRL